MNYYNKTMTGLDQVFNALFDQQQRPTQVTVDEMQDQNSSGGMNDLMRELSAIKSNTNPSFDATPYGKEEKDDDGLLSKLFKGIF